MGEAAKGSGLVVKLKVKLGASQANGITGTQSLSTKSGMLAGARKRLVLQGFPQPGASAAQILDFFKQDAIRDVLVRPWDDSLALPQPAPSTRAPEDSARPTKKARTASAQTCTKRSPGCEPSKANGGSRQEVGALHVAVPESVTGVKTQPCEEAQHAPGSSSSDHATTSVFNQNPSPAEVQTAPVPAPQAPAAKAPGTRPHFGMRRCDGCSTSTQAGNGALLPASLLQLQGSSDAADIFSNLNPSWMHVQLRPLIQQAHTLKDSDVDGMIANAVKVKREGDAKKINNMCTPRTITLYLESSLLFMEACETLLRQPRTSERVQRASTLLVQTANLLQFTIKTCESMGKGAELAREVTRVLCERLAACCFIRESSCNAHRYTDYAQRIGQLLSRTAQQVASAATAGAPHGGSHGGKGAGRKAGTGQQLSPTDSTTSCQEPMAVAQSRGSGAHVRVGSTHHANMAAELAPLQSKLAAAARQARANAELLTRSTNGLQALTERPDVRHNPIALHACAHMTALFMDMGMGDGAEVLAHAFKVLECIRYLS